MRMRDRSSDHWEAGLRVRAERPGGGGGGGGGGGNCEGVPGRWC